jgi:2-polyprenyl-3-methyl-5-hydroxy-6-metoxy-1,4-benzoquinol methylase
VVASGRASTLSTFKGQICGRAFAAACYLHAAVLNGIGCFSLGRTPVPLLKKIASFLARYSEGLRLAVQHGPRSGRVCEYACHNEPQGNGMLGRLIDQAFLRSKAWDGLRQRVGTTKTLVAEVVGNRRAARQSTMILDIAAGTARYLREFAREQGGDDLIIAAHDRDPREVVLGRELVAAEGLSNFTFAVGDATDQSSYLTSQEPDVILAVGLFVHLQDDAAVRTVIQLSFAHLNPGGCFICTTLTGSRVRELGAFVARPALRSAEAIAAWLRETGFVRIDQRFSEPRGVAVIGWKPGP